MAPVKLTAPVREGEIAAAVIAAATAVDTGLLASEVLSTLSNPTIVFVMPVTVPVNVGLANGAFSAIELVTEVAKLALSPRAAASSFNVFRAPGAASTKASIFALTKPAVAI